jgi:GNAT superfamily N-acetyltransferase
MFEIEYRTAKTASDAEITELTELGNVLRKETHPNDPPRLASVQIQELKNLPDFVEFHFWKAHDNNKAVGLANLQILHMPDNQHMAQCSVQILPEYRQKGLGKALLEQLTKVAKNANRSLLLAMTHDRIPAGEAFATQYGFTRGIEHQVSQLQLSELEPDKLKIWIREGETRASNYLLGSWEGAVPEEEIEAFTTLMDVMNTQPKGDLEMEDQHITPEVMREIEKVKFGAGGKRVISYVKHRTTGEFAGYTELEWHPSRAAIVNQEATGVNPAHRNLGLGKWLKAANLEQMLHLNPEAKFVRTGNANVNAAMLKINFELGFKPYFAAIAWQGYTDTILEKLESQALSLA